jgi:hypothetical protein
MGCNSDTEGTQQIALRKRPPAVDWEGEFKERSSWPITVKEQHPGCN